MRSVPHSHMRCSIWSPRRMIYSFTRRLKFSMTRSLIPFEIFAMKPSADLWNSITLCELLWYTLSLQYPNKQKLSGLRSRERGDFLGYKVSTKQFVEVSHRRSCRVWCCAILLKSLTVNLQIFTMLQWPVKGVDCTSTLLLKAKTVNNAVIT